MIQIQVRPGPLTPKLMALVAGLVTQLKLTRSLSRLMFQACLVSTNSLDNHVSHVVELNEALSPIFVYGQETGEFNRNLSPDILAQLAVQTYFGVLISWSLEHGDDDNLLERIETTFELFIRGISK